MTELTPAEPRSSLFHIHVDGAVIPESLEAYIKTQYGFFNDDFEHRLAIGDAREGLEYLPGRQLTLKLRDRTRVRAICEDLRSRAESEGFAGMIQSEYVMTELPLQSEYMDYNHTPFPFRVQQRKIRTESGEDFKTHELHLELPTDGVDHRLIAEIAKSGMSTSFGSSEVTFTVSGTLDQIRKVREGLLSYLRHTRGYGRAKLTTEATIFHSLHRMLPENSPLVIDRIDYLS